MKFASLIRRSVILMVAFFVVASSLRTMAAPEPGGDKPQKVAIPVHFKVEEKGFVSLALYDSEGVLVRSLAYALPVTAGDHELIWDGTTDLGMRAAAGQFTPKAIFFKEQPKIKFVMKVGKSGNPPYRTPDGKGDWGANLGGPCAITSNSNSIMMAWSCVEDGQITGIQQTDTEGNIKLRYFSFYPWDGRYAGAMDETNFYLGIFNGDKKQLEVAEYKLGEPRGKILMALPTKTKPNAQGRVWISITGMAITKDTIYTTVGGDDNVLSLIDRATGKIRRQVAIPAPGGIVVSGENLLVVSEKQILRFKLDGEANGAFVATGTLDGPYALAAEASGNIYASGGNGQVCVFGSDGKLIRRIGKAGGAPRSGLFESSGMGDVTALCIGPDKNLWVQDIATGFQRTSRWSATTGQLQREWFNHTIALSSEVMNPAEPKELINMAGGFADSPGITAYTVDLSAGTWKPGWHYDLAMDDMYMEDVFRSFAHGGNPFNGRRGADTRWPVFTYESRHPVTGPNGLKYFMNESGNGEGAMFVYDASHKPRPVALIGFHHATRDAATGKVEDFYQGSPSNWFSWADRNGDGKMSTDEIIYTENSKAMERVGSVGEAVLDAQLNVHLSLRGSDASGKFCLINKILPRKEILASGAVIYDWSMIRDTVTLLPPNLDGGDQTKKINGYEIYYAREAKDAYYSLVKASSETPMSLPGIDGPTWWASRNWRTKLAKFDKTSGKWLWAVGRRAPGPAKPGEMYHPAYLAGVAGGALFVTDTLGPQWVWNTDGLYLGHVYNDHATGIQDADTIYGETQQTEIYTDPKTGKIFSIANDTAASVHEVLLAKTSPIVVGAVTLTAAQASAAKLWDPDGISPTDRPNWVISYTSRPPNIHTTMYRDGGWMDPPNRKKQLPLILLDGGTLGFMVGNYDEKNLYIACEVGASTPPINSGSELPYAPFVSGAYVDFTFAPNWTGPRSEVRDGDVRVILARIKDGATGWKTFQQGFWQIKKDGKAPYTIVSPAAKLHFDHIAPVPGLEMAYIYADADKPQVYDPKANYIVQVKIPLASLGISNPSGKTIGFDASIGVPNAAGDLRLRAGHWAGSSEAAVVDRPGSAELQPDTWGTMTFLPK